jgi:hypothetical protein
MQDSFTLSILRLAEEFVLTLQRSLHQEETMNNSVVLSVGDTFHLRRGKDRIVYAGMSSDKVYSIVQRKRNFVPYAAWGYAWNLFYPKEQSKIRIDGVNILVENVTPDEIRLRV